jgi:hypothetical protein
MMHAAEGTQQRSELGQTEATVPEACPPADDEALETPAHDDDVDAVDELVDDMHGKHAKQVDAT